MRILAAAALLALLTAPGFSQGINLLAPDTGKDPAAEQKRQESERAYKAASQKIPEQKAVNDPWGNVRGTAEAKSTPAKPRSGTK